MYYLIDLIDKKITDYLLLIYEIVITNHLSSLC